MDGDGGTEDVRDEASVRGKVEGGVEALDGELVVAGKGGDDGSNKALARAR